MHRFFLALALGAALATAPGASPQQPDAPPKLLFVDVDDLGEGFLRQHGGDTFATLEQVGRFYPDFYTSPVCSPTRAQMTYGVRATHPDLLMPWLVGPNHSPYDPPVSGPLEPLPAVLAAEGLLCAKAGKWHQSDVNSFDAPFDVGYHWWRGTMGNIPDYWDWWGVDQGTPVFVQGLYATCVDTVLGIQAMQQGHDFISLSYHSIHDPFHDPPGLLSNGTPEDQASLMLQNLDHELGVLLGWAQAYGYTAVVFGDNGGLQVTGGCKGSPRECGSNTWAYVVGPGVVPGEDPSLVGVVDLYDTALEFFGIADSPTRGPQSHSFLSTWSGGPSAPRTVFVERYTANGVTPDPGLWHYGARSDAHPRYKLRVRFGQEILTDLVANPNDSQNLLNQLPLSPEEQAAYTHLQGVIASWIQ